MKRIIAFVLLLTIVSAASFIVITYSVSKEMVNVIIEENIIYGDKKYADGVKVLARADYDDHLFWDTSYTISEKPKTSTEYSFYYSEHYEKPEITKTGITLDAYLKYGYELSKPLEESTGLQKAYRELYDSIPPGGSGSKVIRLQDYYDYYPVRVNIDLPGVMWSGNDYETLYSKNAREVWNKFNDYFKIPIPEELPAFEISIAKGNNSVSTGGMALSFYFNAINAYSDDTVYFAFRNKYTAEEEGEERYVNTDLIPGGYGIYSINYKSVQNSSDIKGNKSYYGTDYETGIDPNSLTTVYPLEQHQEVIYMVLSQDHGKLMVFTLEDASTYLTVIDLNTMTQLQKILIGGFEEYSFYEFENFIAIRDVDNIAVIEKTDSGLCNLAFSVPRNPQFDRNVRFTGQATTMAFDGERLAIVEKLTDENHNSNGLCGFELAIYTASGLMFYGEYDSSLSSASDSYDYSIRCDLNSYSVAFE